METPDITESPQQEAPTGPGGNADAQDQRDQAIDELEKQLAVQHDINT